MSTLQTLNKTKVFETLCQEVEDHIENNISKWLDDNPYEEIEDDNGKIVRCVPCNRSEARRALCDELYDKAEEFGFGDLFELIINHIYGEGLRPSNKYRACFEDVSSAPLAQIPQNTLSGIVKQQQAFTDRACFPEGANND